MVILLVFFYCCWGILFFSSIRRHTRCALVPGVQTCSLPISAAAADQTWSFRSAIANVCSWHELPMQHFEADRQESTPYAAVRLTSGVADKGSYKDGLTAAIRVSKNAKVALDLLRLASGLCGIIGQLDRRAAISADDLADQRDRREAGAAVGVAVTEIIGEVGAPAKAGAHATDRKSTRLNSRH